MTVRELATQLKLEVCCGAAGLDKEIKGGYTSDLLSDVMGNAREGNIWITLFSDTQKYHGHRFAERTGSHCPGQRLPTGRRFTVFRK